MRARAAAYLSFLTVVVAAATGVAHAESGGAPVTISVQSTKRIRVVVAEGSTLPCESRDNKMLFNATLGPGQSFQGTTDALCVCVKHTTDAFPQSGWSESKLACRPKTCKGRVCKPVPNSTIRVTIDAKR